MSKEKPVKLGQIRNGRLEKASKELNWALDKYICIFLRDVIKAFREDTNSTPYNIYKKYEKEECGDEKAHKEWLSILDEIIEGFDYYLTETKELLSKEEQEVLKAYYDAWVCDLPKGDELLKKLSNPFPIHIKKIIEHEGELTFKQRDRLKETFDLLKEWVAELWW